jgi:hypothetical protein
MSILTYANPNRSLFTLKKHFLISFIVFTFNYKTGTLLSMFFAWNTENNFSIFSVSSPVQIYENRKIIENEVTIL